MKDFKYGLNSKNVKISNLEINFTFTKNEKISTSKMDLINKLQGIQKLNNPPIFFL